MKTVQPTPIDDIEFDFFAMHCGIGKKFHRKNNYVVNVTNQPKYICFFFKCVNVVYHFNLCLALTQ